MIIDGDLLGTGVGGDVTGECDTRREYIIKLFNPKNQH
jgi:hypothetical protein